MIEALDEPERRAENRRQDQRLAEAVVGRERERGHDGITGGSPHASMIAAVCRRKLRVVMYTGLGKPVEPEVKFTKPGHARKDTEPGGAAAGRASGSDERAKPAAAAARASRRSGGGRKTGVSAGNGGELRQALGSAGRTTTGSGRLESAKKSAIVCG